MVKFIFSIAILCGLLYIGNNALPVGDTSLPPVGKFFSPQSGFWKNGNADPNSSVQIAELTSSTSVLVSDRGVPHIFSENLLDAIRAQGYLHAKDRLFQMEVTSRFTAGRLSEFFGERMLNIDKLMRRRGLPFAAENALEGWEKHEESIAVMHAYAEGVNAFINELKPADYPIEYKLLNIAPEPWSPLKSALINKSMTFDLCFRNKDDLASKTLDLLGEKIYEEIFPFRSKKEDPIISKGTVWETEKIIETGDVIEHNFPNKNIIHQQELMPDEAIGSNNWAVSGSRTKSGHPILCNDPHLRLRLPSVWYELQLNASDVNAYGVSLPGAPGIIIGYNKKIAWGSTNVGIDVVDWYKIKWTDKNKGEYEIDGKAYKAKKRIETIKVKDGQTIIDTVYYTVYGPVTYSDDDTHYLHDYALRWIGHDAQAADELGTFIDLNRAQDLDGYVDAVKQFRSPAQNLVYADVENNIALRVSGGIPIRGSGSGEFVYDGSTSANQWKGYVDEDNNPISINPERGFVSSANQISTDSTYPYEYFGYFADFRGRILNEKLAKMNQVTPQDMMDLQNNDESVLARDGMQILLKLVDENKLSEEAKIKLDQLKKWDLHFDANQLEPVIFHKWFFHFYESCWDEFNLAETQMNIPEFWRTIELANEEPTHNLFNIVATEKKEDARDVSTISFEYISNELDSLTEAGAKTNWGHYNGNKIDHLLSLPAFSTDTNMINGFKYALNAVNATHGPSWRMVVELSDPPKAWGVYPGGQSGHPGHVNYQDMVNKWVKGEYYELNLFNDKDAARASASYEIKMSN